MTLDVPIPRASLWILPSVLFAAAMAAGCSGLGSHSVVVVRNGLDVDVVVQLATSAGTESRLVPQHVSMVAHVSAPSANPRLALLRADTCVRLMEISVSTGVSDLDVTGDGEVVQSQGDLDELSDYVLAAPAERCR